MTDLVKFVDDLVPEVKLEPGSVFYWSPKKRLITYRADLINEPTGQWALLHEAAHAVMNHTTYSSDIGLLKLEVEAWDKAKTIAEEIGLEIDEEHIQDCLDTYRDWLHGRSTCPNCAIICMQASPTSYKCHNCNTSWTVSSSRFCRPYRLTIKDNKEKRLRPKTATFS